jgi:hypothetical protein
MPSIPAPSASSGPPRPSGVAFPDALLTPLRLRLLDGLHAGRTWLDLAAELGLMPGEVFTELLPLVAAGLLARDSAGFYLTVRSLWE